MKTHDIKRVLKIAQKFDKVCMEYSGQGEIDWFHCGKLIDFEVERLPFRESNKGNWYRLFSLRLTFAEGVFQAYGLEEFAQDFVGFIGVGFEGQKTHLRVMAEQSERV